MNVCVSCECTHLLPPSPPQVVLAAARCLLHAAVAFLVVDVSLHLAVVVVPSRVAVVVSCGCCCLTLSLLLLSSCVVSCCCCCCCCFSYFMLFGGLLLLSSIHVGGWRIVKLCSAVVCDVAVDACMPLMRTLLSVCVAFVNIDGLVCVSCVDVYEDDVTSSAL